jgi:hypothetical protein
VHQANLNKFSQNKEFSDTLTQATGEVKIGNGFWPEWNALILTRVRAELRQNGEEDFKTI